MTVTLGTLATGRGSVPSVAPVHGLHSEMNNHRGFGMAKVEIVPATMGDAGVQLVTLGICGIYFGAITAIDEQIYGPLPPRWAWVLPALFILGALFVAGGAALLAIGRTATAR